MLRYVEQQKFVKALTQVPFYTSTVYNSMTNGVNIPRYASVCKQVKELLKDREMVDYRRFTDAQKVDFERMVQDTYWGMREG